MNVAEWIVVVLVGYAAAGIAVGLWFVVAAVTRVDPAAKGAHPLFRVMILPGVAALWPWALRRWLMARGAGSRPGSHP